MQVPDNARISRFISQICRSCGFREMLREWDYASSVLITELYTSAALALSQSWYLENGIMIFKILGRHHWHFWLCCVSSHISLHSSANKQRSLLTTKGWCTAFYYSIAEWMRLEGTFGDCPGQPPCSKEGQVEQAVLLPLWQDQTLPSLHCRFCMNILLIEW